MAFEALVVAYLVTGKDTTETTIVHLWKSHTTANELKGCNKSRLQAMDWSRMSALTAALMHPFFFRLLINHPFPQTFSFFHLFERIVRKSDCRLGPQKK